MGCALLAANPYQTCLQSLLGVHLQLKGKRWQRVLTLFRRSVPKFLAKSRCLSCAICHVCNCIDCAAQVPKWLLKSGLIDWTLLRCSRSIPRVWLCFKILKFLLLNILKDSSFLWGHGIELQTTRLAALGAFSKGHPQGQKVPKNLPCRVGTGLAPWLGWCAGTWS